MQFKINRSASPDHATGRLALPVRYADFIPALMLYPKKFGRAQIRRADYILNGELIGAVLDAFGFGKSVSG
jgi:hypothetical protein